MTRAEKRRLHRLLNPVVPSSLRTLRAMADGSLMTVARAKTLLDVEPQSARNCIGKLVRQGFATVETHHRQGIPCTYRITAAGLNAVAEADRKASGAEPEDDIERDLAAEEAERRAGQARAAINVQRARFFVPNSVFALGADRPAPARDWAEAV